MMQNKKVKACLPESGRKSPRAGGSVLYSPLPDYVAERILTTPGKERNFAEFGPEKSIALTKP